jgi:CheY-like chemotaxis protein
VLVNLVMNAAEAIGEATGEVVVATRAVEVGAVPPAGYTLPPRPGRYVRLSVSDTGPGIPPDVRARMFDPFFTTKFAGRGLGLAAVLGIMRAHHGGIAVETAPGRGTTFEVLWPVTGDDPLPSPGPATPPARRSAGTALVVDDEMYVREVTASTLEELGYEPLLAGDGPAALELFRRNGGEAVRVAVIDVMMPGMPGDQLLAELRAIDPRLPAVLVSGFTDHRVMRAGSAPRTEFLQKPFHPEELIAVVQRVLAAD